MKPILFNTQMVKVILEGSKTVTRRIIKTEKKHFKGWIIESYPRKRIGTAFFNNKVNPYNSTNSEYFRPPYKQGDILYVRETFQVVEHEAEDCYAYVYKASENGAAWEDNTEGWTWKPSLHMPKEVARIFLKVTKVKVERLQDITDDQAKKEGIRAFTKDGTLFKYSTSDYDIWSEMPECPIVAFEKLWNSTIKKQDIEKYSFAANPYVWVIEFERCEKPND